MGAWEALSHNKGTINNALLKLHSSPSPTLSSDDEIVGFRMVSESTCCFLVVLLAARIMALENYLGSDFQLAIQMAEELGHSSNSNIVFQDGNWLENAVPSYLDSSYGEVWRSFPRSHI
ncbi:hypothetical protein Ancab_014837 [Ancistrocladus abbreviatus]